MPKAKTVIDHKGQIFPSMTAMLKHYNISKYTFYNKKKKGYSLEQCLSPEINTITDHKNNTFPSVRQMCKHYNITKNTYDYRIQHGWSQEKALTTPSRITTETITDHLGNEFKNIKQLCQYYNIHTATYQGRINAGWSQEDALTTNTKRYTIIDPYTKQKLSATEAAEKYNIKLISLLQRLKHNYSIIETLGIIPLLNRNIKNWKYDDNFMILEEIDINGHNKTDPKQFFLCSINDHEIILTHKRIIQYCESHLQKGENKSNA